MKYINRKRYKKKCIQGEVNFPYGTIFECLENGMIMYNNKPVCYNTSQDAYDYFYNDDDGHGKERGKIIEYILNNTKKDKMKDENKRQQIWELLWSDSFIKNNFKRKEYDEVWIWNFDFYNASLDDLKYIQNTIISVVGDKL